MTALPNLRIDGARLWGELMETAAIGATQKGGICRLTLTDLDRQVRDWFKARAEKLGCTVRVDSVGAMFARRPGRADIPPIAMGSHLDTQPTGGKFDGVLGVLSALEALRTMVEAGYETYGPAPPTCRRARSAAISIPSRPAASSTACSACCRRWRRCAPWSRPATRPTRRWSRRHDPGSHRPDRAG